MILDTITNKNDECYTPKYAVVVLLEFLPAKSNILCPFDIEDSYFVKVLKQAGHNVVFSHIWNGKDFFDYKREDLKEFDFIISNPPYSLKGKVLERLFELGKPFAMLLGIAGIFESKHRYNLFKNNKFEVMYFNKRVDYFSPDRKVKSSPPFSSAYFCQNVLPEQIMFREIDKKNL